MFAKFYLFIANSPEVVLKLRQSTQISIEANNMQILSLQFKCEGNTREFFFRVADAVMVVPAFAFSIWQLLLIVSNYASFDLLYTSASNQSNDGAVNVVNERK